MMTEMKDLDSALSSPYEDPYRRTAPAWYDPGPDLDLTAVDLSFEPGSAADSRHPHLLLMLPWLVMGGAERFTLNLMDQLLQRGWHLSVVTTAPSENPWRAEFARRAQEVHILPQRVALRDYPRYLGGLISDSRFDALLLQGSQEGYRLLPVLRVLFPDLPVLDFLHFVTPGWMDGGFPRLSLLYRDCIDLTVCSCQQVKKWMLAQGAQADRLRVCHINVDPSIYRPDAEARQRLRAQQGVRMDEAVLLYAARLEAQKQPEVFIETLRQLDAQGLSFKAWIAGDGSQRGLLQEKIGAYRLEPSVRLLGSVPSSEMPGLMAAADILFLPSENEGISQAVYEGMACGLVTVAADVGGQAELVTPECGILVAPTEAQAAPAAFTAALRALLTDPRLRAEMGRQARERILSQFTLEQMGAKMEDFIEEAQRLRKDSAYQAGRLSPEEELRREARHTIEYLQARHETRRLSAEIVGLSARLDKVTQAYYALIQPKPPSHWFYLWLRQLFLPMYRWMDGPGRGSILSRVKRAVKSILLGKRSHE